MELRDQIQQALADPGFEKAWALAEPIEGWMTREQGAALWALATAVRPGGSIVEIGSYRGRSMSILARAAADGVTLVAIDPHAGNDRGPQQWVGTADEGQSDNEIFWANLATAGVADRVRHVRRFSQEATDSVSDPIDLLYIDGAHGYRPALTDLRDWGAKVAPEGTMAVHDCYSSIGVTLALLRSITFSGDWTALGRTRSLAAWRAEPVGSRQRPANLARQLVSLPWFMRNVVVKAAVVARLRPLARLLGSDGATWPY
jgi:predicted O-methyltransferase YrrM